MKSVFFFFVLIAVSPTFAQFSIHDKELVRTTFAREFDKAIIQKYLDSGGEEKINAALLSISHSEDTSFIPSIVKFDDEHLEFIAFALGQLGENQLSENFLLSKLNQKNSEQLNFILMGELGKIISPDKFDSLVNNYSERFGSGISLLISNYHLRGLKYDRKKSAFILSDELAGRNQQKFNALYCAFRTNLCEYIKDDIISTLNGTSSFLDLESIESTKRDILVYSLACLRRLKFFPDDEKLFQSTLATPHYPVIIEAIKSAVYKNNFSVTDFLVYIKLLHNENLNVAMQSATSLKEIKIKEDVSSFILEELFSRTLDKRILGELSLSFYQLYPNIFLRKWEEIKTLLHAEHILDVYNLLGLAYFKTDSLLNSYSSASGMIRIKTLELLLNDKNNSAGSSAKFMIDVLNSSFAAGISIVADGIDSTFIDRYKNKLKQIIINQTNEYVHNSGYIESLMSLANLALKISKEFEAEILELLSNSDLYSVRKFAESKLQKKFSGGKEMNYFENIWNNSFKFSSAIINTEKGSFEIEFLPQYAPVSVGSFCYLAQLNFFKGINFHRVVPGFVIQAGDPTGTGWGGAEYEIVSEFSPLNFNVGLVGMASAEKDTEGSQWFVMQGNFPHLDGKYSVFGKIKTGIESVLNTGQGDKIVKVELKN